ncbi:MULTISPECIES: hypothetical protein [Aeromonas]|uniref:Uncharacterized protein n=1 Tax=Aeromonas caviae TaxID=648 RepID=A0AA42VAS2_AERCA|nr:hypothetical protein [Aeromonas caviae]MDH1897730.1 hypothetical protein [Aeromonas caviae]
MSLILELLKPCLVDQISWTQSQLIKLPPNDVSFMLDTARTLHVLIVNDKSEFTRRLYAVDQSLTKEFGDLIKPYAFVPYRTELGTVGMMQVNLQSRDGYSSAKRELIEAGTKIYSVTRLIDAYDFSERKDASDIEPISDIEYETVLDLVFSRSIVSNREHPIFQRFAKPTTTINEDGKCSENNNDKGCNAMRPHLADDYVLNIDINLDTINDIM